jgi:hypothetical protein
MSNERGLSGPPFPSPAPWRRRAQPFPRYSTCKPCWDFRFTSLAGTDYTFNRLRCEFLEAVVLLCLIELEPLNDCRGAVNWLRPSRTETLNRGDLEQA